MEPRDDITKTQDIRMRKRSEWLVAIVINIFMLVYAIFIGIYYGH